MYDVYSAIVYALKSSDVRTTVVGGKVVMEDRRMLTLDYGNPGKGDGIRQTDPCVVWYEKETRWEMMDRGGG